MTWDLALRRLAAQGLNVVGVASIASYDEHCRPELRSGVLAPWARSVVVLGSGGPALWGAMVAELEGEPRRLAESAHPVDRFVERAARGAETLLAPARRRWFFTSAEETTHLDFRTLGLAAGLGAVSRLGLLIHPLHGPWLGLRAACFTEEELEPTAALGEGPCDSCPAPCISVCPAGALASGRWEVGICADFHRASTRCDQSCEARLACPVGAESRYPPEEVLYHYDRRAGRRWLRERVGLPAAEDPHEGVGPHWEKW